MDRRNKVDATQSDGIIKWLDMGREIRSLFHRNFDKLTQNQSLVVRTMFPSVKAYRFRNNVWLKLHFFFIFIFHQPLKYRSSSNLIEEIFNSAKSLRSKWCSLLFRSKACVTYVLERYGLFPTLSHRGDTLIIVM